MTIRLVQGETGEGRYRGGGGHGAISWEQMIGLFPVPSDHEYCLGIVRSTRRYNVHYSAAATTKAYRSYSVPGKTD